MKNKNLDQKLKESKKSFTQQRRVVLEELDNIDEHVTADQIYSIVKKRMPRVSVGTIYRNLAVLVELGFVDKVDTSFHSESHYEVSHGDHYHIICKECLRIDDLEHYRALSIEPTAQKITGYEVMGHSIELFGICPQCKKNDNTVNPENITKEEPKKTTMVSQSEFRKEKKEQKPNTELAEKPKPFQPPIRKTNKPNNKRRFFFGRRNENNL